MYVFYAGITQSKTYVSFAKITTNNLLGSSVERIRFPFLFLQIAEDRYHASNNTFTEIKIGKNLSDIFITYPELKQWPTVAVPMKAGSASFHSGHLIHGAGANMTSRRRAAMTIQM